ncbi:hypothetical protein [Sphingomonas sp. SRS2]|uniref:hypothetical protein n=1 Tax=Sphingomonas sp. SRS2 TaxID=133190 RepID=UPI0006184B89|nr:hypothetical protein [Sphingomonas sp. SRS2]KKC24220.1 hypothetical protein WP12_20570 [Sphingomonas sp. SRS2]
MTTDPPEPLALPSPAAAPPDPSVAQVVEDVRDLVGAGIRLDQELVAAAVRGWSNNTRRAFCSDLAQSARSCDFGHVEEQRLNMAIYQARSCPPIS